MFRKFYFIHFLMLMAVMGSSLQSQNEPGIQGVWKVERMVTTVDDRSFENTQPLPGLMIFTEGFYSMVWMPGTEGVPDNAKIWYPSDQEKINQFNALIVNSGTYAVRDSLLITEPMVAKTPEFVGGKATYHHILNKDTLTLFIKEIVSRGGVLDEGPQQYRTTLYLKRSE
ncbi:MAG: lipocalin-like domain-containing protein [bacterium]|nr:MAG: lipocalin-like domain-containing protein [bacterium]